MENYTRPVALAVIAATLTIWVEPARAADDTLEEITVTAQRRTESAQEVPIAMSVFSAQQLEQLGIESSSDLTRLTPNLTWSPSGVTNAVGLRGVVDTIFTTNQVGSVAIVIDEVGMNSPVTNTFAMLDMERVEVLRGPQVTLYGRSTTGGAINFVTRRPDPKDGLNGYATARVGRFNQADIEAAVGIPAGERSAWRVAVKSENRDGVMTNKTLKTKDTDVERHLVRASFTSQLSDSADLFATAYYGINRGESSRYKAVGLTNPVTGQPCNLSEGKPGNGCADGGGFVDSANYSENFSNLPNPLQDIDSYGASLNLGMNLGNTRLTSITGYQSNEVQRSEDNDGGPLSLTDVYYEAETDQISQELRLASTEGSAAHQWVAGVFYLKETQDGITAAAFRAPIAGGPPPQFRSLRYLQDNKVTSAFAQVDWAIADRLTLSTGIRYSRETKEGTAETLRAGGAYAATRYPALSVMIGRSLARQIANPAESNVQPDAYGQTWENWGGKISFNFQQTDNALWYASISEGFKGGTFNLAAAVRLPFPAQLANFRAGVRPEKLRTYEIGGKFDLIDDTLRLNFAAFRNDYSDQQNFVFKDGGPVLLNAAESTIDGTELELQWLPARGWLLTSAIGTLDATYDTFIDPSGTNYSGKRMVLAPKLNVSGLVRKTWSMGSGEMSAQTNWRYVDDIYHGVANAPVELIRANTVVDARLSYVFGERKHIEAALWGSNLGDERFCVSIGTVPAGLGQCVPNEPRSYGLYGSIKF